MGERTDTEQNHSLNKVPSHDACQSGNCQSRAEGHPVSNRHSGLKSARRRQIQQIQVPSVRQSRSTGFPSWFPGVSLAFRELVLGWRCRTSINLGI